MFPCSSFSFFFFNDTATTEIYTLSLHDALPICVLTPANQLTLLRMFLIPAFVILVVYGHLGWALVVFVTADRKSTRLNSSHLVISYAVFCLKKKNITPR